MDLKRSVSDVKPTQVTAPYTMQRGLKWVCSGICVGLVASWSGLAEAQSKLPSRSGVICYGDYRSLASMFSEYCEEDESCSGVRKPPSNDIGLPYFFSGGTRSR